MSLLKRIFEKRQEEPTEEEKIVQELKDYINGLNAPAEVKYWLREAIRSSKKDDFCGYMRAVEKVNYEFVSPEFAEKNGQLKNIAAAKVVPYWLKVAEENAKNGDLNYLDNLDNAEHYARRRGNRIDGERARIHKLFEENKWSKAPPRLEELLREGVRKMRRGEPQKKVDVVLDEAEKYAKALGYNIRKSDEVLR